MRFKIQIGTAGWNYPHWREIFYPSCLPQSKWLEFYAAHFDTVELNATFYCLPNPATFENWRKRVPENFLWAIKANRYITHIKRLKDSEESLKKFYDRVSLLKEKCGPLLFQLPPGLSFDEDIFKEFYSLLDCRYLHALEVRNRHWINDHLFAILKEHNIAFCISDTAGRFPYHEEVTADFVYIRLHGSKKLYASEYSEAELQNWADKIKKWSRDTFIYFDNDFEGYAVSNAQQIKELFGGPAYK